MLLRHEMFLHVSRHVQSQWERKVSVNFFLKHREHVECVSHGVEAQNMRQFLEARPEFEHSYIYIHKINKSQLPLLSSDLLAALRASVHVVSLESVLDCDLVQTLVEIPHVCHLTPHCVEFLHVSAHVVAILMSDRFNDIAQCCSQGIQTRDTKLLLSTPQNRVLTNFLSSGVISSSLETRSMKNSAMSFCSPVLRGWWSIWYTLQKLRGL